MNYSSETDGIDHINTYSKGKTELGRFLSNFARHRIKTEDGYFRSVEGYWYWLGCTHENKDRLKTLHGFNAKKVGRELGSPDWLDDDIFKNKIKKAITNKVETMPKHLQKEFLNCNLPFVHYYEYGGKVVNVPEADWIIDHLNKVKKGL